MSYASLKELQMNMQRKASLFRNGRSQAVRIPKDFELPGKDVMITKEGGRLVIAPAEPKQSLGDWLATLEPLAPEDRMPFIEDLPAEPVDL
jgi:antitoxin VapB